MTRPDPTRETSKPPDPTRGSGHDPGKALVICIIHGSIIGICTMYAAMYLRRPQSHPRISQLDAGSTYPVKSSVVPTSYQAPVVLVAPVSYLVSDTFDIVFLLLLYIYCCSIECRPGRKCKDRFVYVPEIFSAPITSKKTNLRWER